MTVPILSVYDAQGNEIPIPAIRGEKGENGNNGQNGADGITPMIGVNGNWWIGSTDTGRPARGEQGQSGTAGHTPVKGTDYWTTSDKAEIIEDVLEEIYQGADLGLQIVTQLNRPASPADNMIWVETETAMPVGKFMVSSQQPTSGVVNGFLWFREMYLPLVEITLPGSHVSMSVAQVWQYENGAWVWKKGHVYKAADEEWKDTGVYWFKSGTGFNTDVFGAVYEDVNNVSANNDYFEIDTGFMSCQTVQSAGKFRYFIIDASVSSYQTTLSGVLTFGVGGTNHDDSFIVSQHISPGTRDVVVVDISSVNTGFYPKCSVSYGVGKIYNIWLV